MHNTRGGRAVVVKDVKAQTAVTLKGLKSMENTAVATHLDGM